MGRQAKKEYIVTIDAINNHLRQGIQPIRSYAAGVQAVMNLKSPAVKRLLTDMLDFKPDMNMESAIVYKLATAHLVQSELKFRGENEGMSFLPFQQVDFDEAMEYAKSHAEEYSKTMATEDEPTKTTEDGESKPKGKRGRKGGTFDLVRGYFVSNPNLLEGKAKDAAQKVAEATGVAYNTALVYTYKCIKLQKEGKL